MNDLINLKFVKLLVDLNFYQLNKNLNNNTTTYSSVLKWLRKQYNIYICIIGFTESNTWGATITNIKTNKKSSIQPVITIERAIEDSVDKILNELIKTK